MAVEELVNEDFFSIKRFDMNKLYFFPSKENEINVCGE